MWDSQRHKSQTPPRRGKEPEAVDGVQLLEPEPAMGTTTHSGGSFLSATTDEDSILSDSPPLVVNVSVKFTDLTIRSTYRRTYGSSHGFRPSDRVCDGLVRRIEHCCEELITRRDSTALRPCKEGTGTPKHLKFEMTFCILRRDTGERTERAFKSYQNEPLTVTFAKEITLASHRMIGLFLSHHDREFRWLDGPLREGHHHGPETFVPMLDAPLPSCCIPRSRFIESSQSFEFIPGYTIEVSFRSRSQQRPTFEKVLKVNSRQNSPLNLMLSENLLWQSFQPIHLALESRKRQFDEKHGGCELLEGTSACRHFDDDALHLVLRLKNNLGPSYNHLRREIRSKLTIFGDRGRDCHSFLNTIETQLMEARDQSDSKINQMNDFELRILELKSPTWSTSDPFRFSLDPSASYSRRSIDAVLERVQSGIGDVLRGNNVATRVSAYKRGHLILDKAFVARQNPDKLQNDASSLENQGKDLVSQLRLRIQEDIGKVCKDTCSLSNIPEDEGSSKTQEAEVALAPMSKLDTQDGSSLSAEQDDDSAEGPSPVTKVTTRPNSTCTLPGVAPGQRFFPLVPDKFFSPTRVSSGCLLENESFDIPGGTQTHDDALDRSPNQEVAFQEIETPTQDGQSHPIEAVARSLATDSVAEIDFGKRDRIDAQDPVLTDAGECSPPLVEAASSIAGALGEHGQTMEDALPAVQIPVLGVEEVVVAADDAAPAEELESAEELEVAKKLGLIGEPEPTEEPEPIEVLELVKTAEVDNDTELVEEAEPEEEPVFVEASNPLETSGIEVSETEAPEPAAEPDAVAEVPSDGLEAIEQVVEDLGEEHEETCSLNAEPNITQTLADLSEKQGTPSRVSGFADIEGGDWTAPSTPSLSSGCESSPRHSLIITPSNLATLAGVEKPRLRGLGVDYMRHEFEPETDSIHDDVDEDGTADTSVCIRYRAIFPPRFDLASHTSGDSFSDFFADDARELPETEDSILGHRAGSRSSELEGQQQDNARLPIHDDLEAPQSPLPDALADANPFQTETEETRVPTNADMEHIPESEQDNPSVPGPEVAEFDCGSSFLDAEPDSSTPRKSGHFSVSEPEVARVQGLDDRECELPSESEERPIEKPEPENSAKPALGSPFLFSPPAFTSPDDNVHSSQHEPPHHHEVDGPSGRGSVDDFPPLENELGNETAPAKDYRPATAGYLGLHERRIVEVGLRGALGGSRRFSLPLDHLLDAPGPGAAASLVPVTKPSARSDSGAKKDAKRPKSFFGSKLGHHLDAESDGLALPRMVMIFAGMALASKVLNKAD